MAQEGGRQRMRPWLEYHINNRTTPGLLWIDTQQKLFRVPWKHVGNRDWTETDGTIFKMWAHHTGKYRENIDQPDWPTWKTRFRCALTKLPDIKERKELNRLDGQTDEPYRVYQFVARSNNENIDPGRKSHEDMYMDESSMQQETFTPDQSSQRLPTVLLSSSSEHQQSADPQLDSDLNNIEVGDLMKLNSSDMRECIQNDTELMEGVDDTGGEGSLKGIRDIGRKCYPGQTRPNYINIKDDWTIDHTDCKLYIVVKYLLLRVIEKLCSNPNGCRIFYDKHIRFANKQEFTEMYGSPGVEPIYLPECENMMQAQQQKLTLDLLHAADRGLILTVRNGSIFATRNCRCRVYISTPSIDNGEVIKLDRDQETNIFDLDKYFRPALDRYIQQSGPKPSAEVIIGFGQHFKNDRESINDLLVSVSVVHTEAYSLLTRICCSNPTDLPIDLSNSDDKDRAMDIVQHQQQYEQQSQMI